MTITANVYEIAILLVSLAFLVLVIVLIPMILQLRRTVKAMEELTVESRKTVESLNEIIKTQAGDIDELVKKTKDVGLKFVALGDLLADNIKSPLITMISLLFGVKHGFRRFFRRREKKGGGGDATH